MLDKYKVITLNHHGIEIQHLGKFVVKGDAPNEIHHSLKLIKDKFQIEEMIYLNTCNRVSFILFADIDMNIEFIRSFFSEINNNLSESDFEMLDSSVSVYEGIEAIQHVLEIAGSIDSLVVGEREIFRQLREAYEFSKEMGLTGDKLRLLEKTMVQTGKSIYSNTRIGEKPLSVASLAVQALIAESVPLDANVLMIGAGETNTLVAKFLLKNGFSNFTIFNRSIENGEKLATMVAGKAYLLSELNNYKGHFDIIVLATSATEPIINGSNYQQLSNNNQGKVFVLDLAVPANFDSNLAATHPIKYIYIDEIKALAKKNLEFRKQEVAIAKEIVKKSITEFRKTFAQRNLELTLRDLPNEVAKIKEKAINEVFSEEYQALDENSKLIVSKMLDYMEKKCVGVPMKLAKSSL